MAFSDDVVEQAWGRAGGKCECTRTTHGHWGRCNTPLLWAARGREGWGAWEAHHIDGNPNNDFLTNCEILCWPCHKKTL
jgi:hypothetical protein